MQINTSKGGSFDADFLLEMPVENSLLIQLRGETRPLSSFSRDFENLAWLETDDGRTFEGYSDLRAAVRLDGQKVQLHLYPAAGENL